MCLLNCKNKKLSTKKDPNSLSSGNIIWLKVITMFARIIEFLYLSTFGFVQYFTFIDAIIN